MIAIEQLATTADILRALLSGVRHEQTYWKPSPERFSIAELLEHWSHVEGHYFRLTVDEILAVDSPEIAGYDQDVFFRDGAYSGRDPEESLAHWEEQREGNVELLRGLDAEQFAREAIHAELGVFTLAQLVNEWALHDLGHVRQLAELVRAQLFYPEIGPFQAQYTVKP